ncbi:MAG: OmpA family protein [Terriglobales bacterium]
MRNLLAAILVLGLCLPTVAQRNPKDRKGCEDSKVLSRMSGCFIHFCRNAGYDAAKFRIKGPKGVTDETVEGVTERIDYQCAPETSMIEIIRNVEQALRRAGFTIKFQQDGANWAGVTGQKGPQWVWVQSRRGSYHLQTVRAKALDQQIEANAEGWAQQIEQTGRASIYGINFDTGKATIRPDSASVLAEVLSLLQKNPAWRLAVTGHTDNVGGKAMNLALSKQRAQSVVAWLTARGIADDRLLAGGFGDLAPIADNTSEVGRAKNRRVDLIKLY